MKPHIPYVYRLTDRETGKRYIGSRYAKVCEPADLGVSYFTSSKTLSQIFRADPARFEKQIIVTGDKNYVMGVERSMLVFHDAMLSEGFYNRTNNAGVHPEDNRRGGLKSKAEKTGIFSLTKEQQRVNGLNVHLDKDAAGRSVVAVKLGKLSAERRSILGVSYLTQEGRSLGGVRSGNAAKENRTGVHAFTKDERATLINKQHELKTPEGKSALAVSGGRVGGKIVGKKNAESGLLALLAKQRWCCLACGMISGPSQIAGHQRASGHSGKEKVQ